MSKIQAAAIPESHRSLLTQLNRDFRAALSYVSFYSADSPFVVQSIEKLHRGFKRVLQAVDQTVFHLVDGKLMVNDFDGSEFTDLFKLLYEKNIPGFVIRAGVAQAELSRFVRRITTPIIEPEGGNDETHSHIAFLSGEDEVEIIACEMDPALSIEEIPVTEDLQPSQDPSLEDAASLDFTEVPPFSLKELGISEKTPVLELSVPVRESSRKTNEALLGFVAEAWQHSQLQKKNIGAAPEMVGLTQSFEKLFDRLLDRMEKTSPEFRNIYQWFKSPPGELMESEVVSAMFPLIEVAVQNDWTSILFDPATEGLVNDCLAHWGANGKHELVEKTVACLAEGLNGGILERQVALTHLMDARPWVRNPELLEKVLDQLNLLLANETFPALYQSGLLSAWDLIEPAIEKGKELPVLTLLSTLHFHADEDNESFPERAHIARHWLFERSTPELIRLFVSLAFKAGQLEHFPLLGEMAAPTLLKNFLKAAPAEKSGFFLLFAEIKEPMRSALAEWLADVQEESEVLQGIPILRVCGMDAALSLLLSSWISRGTPELKMNLIGLIEEVNDKAGGPALRLALFDDSEEIAAMAARVIGKIQFAAGIPVLLKAAKIRESRFPNNDLYLTSVCQALGDLGKEEAFPFLQDLARKKPLLRGKNFSLPVRLEAIRAITRINQPEVWHFVESLMEEKNPALQRALEKIIEEKSDSHS